MASVPSFTGRPSGRLFLSPQQCLPNDPQPRPLRPLLPIDTPLQHPHDDLLLQGPHPFQLGEPLGVLPVEFFLVFHFQDRRAQVGGRLPKGFIPVGVTGDDVRVKNDDGVPSVTRTTRPVRSRSDTMAG